MLKNELGYTGGKKIPETSGKGPVPDISLDNGKVEIEVKARSKRESIGIGTQQALTMIRKQNTENVRGYYALCFFQIMSEQRGFKLQHQMGNILNQAQFQDFQKSIIEQIKLETIFIFPVQIIIDYFNSRIDQRTGKHITPKRSSQWSSNIGPMKKYFNSLDINKQILKKDGVEFYIIGEEMNQRIGTILKNDKNH